LPESHRLSSGISDGESRRRRRLGGLAMAGGATSGGRTRMRTTPTLCAAASCSDEQQDQPGSDLQTGREPAAWHARIAGETSQLFTMYSADLFRSFFCAMKRMRPHNGVAILLVFVSAVCAQESVPSNATLVSFSSSGGTVYGFLY